MNDKYPSVDIEFALSQLIEASEKALDFMSTHRINGENAKEVIAELSLAIRAGQKHGIAKIKAVASLEERVDERFESH